MEDLKELINQILNEIEHKENIINLSGGRGYGVGEAKPKDPHPVSRNLGKGYGEEQEEYELKPVKVSKAFKRRK